jgi:hypothetical protein
MTTTRTPNPPADVQGAECGPDCIYLDGACRCYHGEPATDPLVQQLRGIQPPF